MKYLIDCGASHCKIAVIEQPTRMFKLQGFNPQNGVWQAFEQQLKDFIDQQDGRCSAMTFYGAGLATPELKERMKSLLIGVAHLHSEQVHVYSDLLAPAHAVYKERPVLVGILGTGSNVGYFDGKLLTRQTPSLGFLLGDEGSGFDLGRRLLLAYHYNQLSGELSRRLDEISDMSVRHVIELHMQPERLHMLCSQLSVVVGEYAHDETVSRLCQSAFAAFVENRVRPELKPGRTIEVIHLFGGVAVQFENLLSQILASRLNISASFYSNPLDRLVEIEAHK